MLMFYQVDKVQKSGYCAAFAGWNLLVRQGWERTNFYVSVCQPELLVNRAVNTGDDALERISDPATQPIPHDCYIPSTAQRPKKRNRDSNRSISTPEKFWN